MLFHWALLVPKAATYFDTLQTFLASPLSFSDLAFEIFYQQYSTAKWSALLLGDGEIFIVSGDQVEMQMVVFQHPNKIRGDKLPLS